LDRHLSLSGREQLRHIRTVLYYIAHAIDDCNLRWLQRLLAANLSRVAHFASFGLIVRVQRDVNHKIAIKSRLEDSHVSSSSNVELLLILTPQCRWIERRGAPVKTGHISDKIHAPPADSAGIPIEADQPYDVQALPWLQSMRSMSAAKSLYRSPRLWVAERIAAVASRCWSSGSAAISALIESRCRRSS
jgi:hypothetical protein